MSLHTWFQNFDDSHHWVHFRGSVGRTWERDWFRYEFCTGLALSLSVQGAERGTLFTFGLLFCTLYLTLPVQWVQRQYGFYVHEWRLCAFFGSRPMESSSKDPWYYRIAWDIPKTLFGRAWHFEDERLTNYEQPILFEYRGKQYQMDKIRITDSYWFRSRIPFGLWRRKIQRMHLDIKDPPKYAGKGENSWDCGDDGSYGTTQPYKGPAPIWTNNDAVFEWCCRKYCEDTSGYIRRYGRASGDDVPPEAIGFKYLGRKRDPMAGECAVEAGNVPPSNGSGDG